MDDNKREKRIEELEEHAKSKGWVKADVLEEWGHTLRLKEEGVTPVVVDAVGAVMRDRMAAWENVTGRWSQGVTRGPRQALDYYDQTVREAVAEEESVFALADYYVSEWISGTVKSPNYVLYNRYVGEDAHARWHNDTPEALEEDYILSMSFNDLAIFLLQRVAETSTTYYVVLPPRAVLLMGPNVNSSFLHSVAPLRHLYRSPRLSLTFRRVISFDP
mmetsp:Transcript_9480/g.26595  ORF Transcript_9480/g.26595 Transcript_9480/m.26595 type:complete len:218 (-) Transcript_9480:147-800(-)|eukprot:CAMPEP_0119126450 /NCGR_PEP_ID=MMETSP1310-20130426/5371_1 /TAXON_ID=464262 /ORGANISM="Genus nov. species nov., Strain RCC2339" /LENGTH=217 /DNA_ID=CAMNT_0007116613 /DNA_START=104 /DNA_END=757 /DNA_ORIENTATION=-